MGEGIATGMTRRQLIKRSVVAGGLAWVAPSLIASPAGATVTCDICVTGTVFGLRHDWNGGCRSPGNVNDGTNCIAQQWTTARNGCCLLANGTVQFSQSLVGGVRTHTYILAPGVDFCSGGVRCGTICQFHEDPHNAFFADDSGPGGTTVVVARCDDLAYSEVLFCVNGSALITGCP